MTAANLAQLGCVSCLGLLDTSCPVLELPLRTIISASSEDSWTLGLQGGSVVRPGSGLITLGPGLSLHASELECYRQSAWVCTPALPLAGGV